MSEGSNGALRAVKINFSRDGFFLKSKEFYTFVIILWSKVMGFVFQSFQREDLKSSCLMKVDRWKGRPRIVLMVVNVWQGIFDHEFGSRSQNVNQFNHINVLTAWEKKCFESIQFSAIGDWHLFHDNAICVSAKVQHLYMTLTERRPLRQLCMKGHKDVGLFLLFFYLRNHLRTVCGVGSTYQTIVFSNLLAPAAMFLCTASWYLFLCSSSERLSVSTGEPSGLVIDPPSLLESSLLSPPSPCCAKLRPRMFWPPPQMSRLAKATGSVVVMFAWNEASCEAAAAVSCSRKLMLLRPWICSVQKTNSKQISHE